MLEPALHLLVALGQAPEHRRGGHEQQGHHDAQRERAGRVRDQPLGDHGLELDEHRAATAAVRPRFPAARVTVGGANIVERMRPPPGSASSRGPGGPGVGAEALRDRPGGRTGVGQQRAVRAVHRDVAQAGVGLLREQALAGPRASGRPRWPRYAWTTAPMSRSFWPL